MSAFESIKLRSEDGAHELVGPYSVGRKDYFCVCGGSLSCSYFGEIEARFYDHVKSLGGAMTKPMETLRLDGIIDEAATSD